MTVVLIWLPIIISAFALTISYLAYRSTKSKIKVRIPDTATIFPSGAAYLYIDENSIFPIGPGVHTTIEFINYGDKDISYFDLDILNKAGEHSWIVTRSSISQLIDKPTKNINMITQDGIEPQKIPSDSFEIIPAHTYKKIDILILNVPSSATDIPIIFQLSKTPNIIFRLKTFINSHTGKKIKVSGTNNLESYPEFVEFPIFKENLDKIDKKMRSKIDKVHNNLRNHGTPFDKIKYNKY